MEPAFFQRLVEPLVAGRKWIVTPDVLAGATTLVERLHGMDCSLFLVAGGVGTGPVPPADQAHRYLLHTSGQTVMGAMRAFQSALAAPPADLCEAIERWDPAREAEVLGSFLNTTQPLCGRRIVGGVPDEWRATENKITVDALWDAAGIERPPSEVVSADDGRAIEQAVARLASDEGSVVVGDNREGWHGGGEYARYLRAGRDHTDALRFFAAHCDEVRVTPFLRGVPSSIHGFVLDDAVLAFRPVEMMVFRRRGRDAFLYGALNTLWDPPDEVRGEMRETVRRVGAVLRTQVGYRGAFGIDGVVTDAGFLPTELNPRFSPGLMMQAAAAGIPLGDIHRFTVDGRALDFEPAQLEEAVVTAADRRRTGRCLTPVYGRSVDETLEVNVDWREGGWTTTSEDSADASLRLGPAPLGAVVMLTLNDHHSIEPGPSFAPKAAMALAVADRLWNTGIGPLVAGFESVS